MERLRPANFRGAQHGVIVTVCEGKGEVGDPYREVYYVYTPDLYLIGTIDYCCGQGDSQEDECPPA